MLQSRRRDMMEGRHMMPYEAVQSNLPQSPLKMHETRTTVGVAESSAGGQNSRSGRWSPDEKLLFLHGLSIHGKGKWKKIRQFLPSRTLVQIKSHAQKVLKREAAGEDVMAPLRTEKDRLATLLEKETAKPKLRRPLSSSLMATAQKLKPKIPTYKHSHHASHVIDGPMQLMTDCSTADGHFRFRVTNNVRRSYPKTPMYSARFGATGGPYFAHHASYGVSFAFPPPRGMPVDERTSPDDDSGTSDVCKNNMAMGSASAQVRHVAQSRSVAGNVTDTPPTAALGGGGGVKYVDEKSPACVTPERRHKQVDVMAAANSLCQLSNMTKKKAAVSGELPYMISP